MSGYTTAWWLVGGGGLLCLLAVAMLLRHAVRPVLLWPFLLLLAALLLVPAPHPGAEGIWAPAFVVALFEGLFQPSGQPTVALRLLLAGCLVTLAVSLGVSSLIALRKRGAPPSAEPGADS